MDIGMPELLIILIIIILVFGVGRVGKLGGELGKGIRSFREGLNGTDVDKTQPESNPETKNADKHEEI
jgi:sec-independent protein translocase protein TatA